MQNKSDNIELVNVNSLIPHPKNMHDHSDEQIERLAKLIEYQNGELWKITECKRYSVSSNGRLFSFIRSRLKKATKTRDGYLTYSIGRKTVQAHRLIAKYFSDGYSEDLQVNHIDLDRQNNNIKNLEMLTFKQNIDHSVRLGRYIKKGENNNNCKYDDIKILTIRACAYFFTDKKISEQLGLSRKYVNDVKLGKIRGQ